MSEHLEAATTIAREAGAILAQGYGTSIPVDYKGEVDLVTDYDVRSEEHILARLSTLFPSDSIRAEEGVQPTIIDDAEFEWYVDPLDGTTNFAHGFPFFAVSIAVAHHGQVIAGAVFDPLRDEMFAACQNSGATLNNRPIHVSTTSTLNRSLVATGFPYDVRTTQRNNLEEFSLFSIHAQGVRRAGAAALDLCYTACGRLDGFWELSLKSWDMAAGGLIVQEAGGEISSCTRGHDWLTDSSVAASNGIIHTEMLELVSRAV